MSELHFRKWPCPCIRGGGLAAGVESGDSEYNCAISCFSQFLQSLLEQLYFICFGFESVSLHSPSVKMRPCHGAGYSILCDFCCCDLLETRSPGALMAFVLISN